MTKSQPWIGIYLLSRGVSNCPGSSQDPDGKSNHTIKGVKLSEGILATGKRILLHVSACGVFRTVCVAQSAAVTQHGRHLSKIEQKINDITTQQGTRRAAIR